MEELKIMDWVPKKDFIALSYLKNEFLHQSVTGFVGTLCA